MVQHEAADTPVDGDEALKNELQLTRGAVEHLAEEVVALRRRSVLNWVVTITVLVLLAAVAAGASYGYFYIQDARDKDRAELAEDRESLERTLFTGCENSVDQQENNREELLEFGRYLGLRSDLPQEQINAALNELIVRFNEINPPRDCVAEAEARQAERED